MNSFIKKSIFFIINMVLVFIFFHNIYANIEWFIVLSIIMIYSILLRFITNRLFLKDIPIKYIFSIVSGSSFLLFLERGLNLFDVETVRNLISVTILLIVYFDFINYYDINKK